MQHAVTSTGNVLQKELTGEGGERGRQGAVSREVVEAMNFMAVNLAHEIVTGQRRVEDARQLYAETAAGFMLRRPSLYTEQLQFAVPHSGTADADESMIAGAMVDQMVEKAKDVFGGERE